MSEQGKKRRMDENEGRILAGLLKKRRIDNAVEERTEIKQNKEVSIITQAAGKEGRK